MLEEWAAVKAIDKFEGVKENSNPSDQSTSSFILAAQKLIPGPWVKEYGWFYLNLW